MKKAAAVIIAMLALFVLANTAQAADEGFQGYYRSFNRGTCSDTAHYRVSRPGPRIAVLREVRVGYSVTLRRKGGNWKGTDTDGGVTRTFNLDYHTDTDRATGTRHNEWTKNGVHMSCTAHMRLKSY